MIDQCLWCVSCTAIPQVLWTGLGSGAILQGGVSRCWDTQRFGWIAVVIQLVSPLQNSLTCRHIFVFCDVVWYSSPTSMIMCVCVRVKRREEQFRRNSWKWFKMTGQHCLPQKNDKRQWQNNIQMGYNFFLLFIPKFPHKTENDPVSQWAKDLLCCASFWMLLQKMLYTTSSLCKTTALGLVLGETVPWQPISPPCDISS